MTIVEARYLWDARNAAETIGRFTARHDFAGYRSSRLLQAAVERMFTILGEALSLLRKASPGIAEQIPDLARAVGLRNLIVHRYWRVEHDRIWDVITHDLQPFLHVVERLLKDYPLP